MLPGVQLDHVQYVADGPVLDAWSRILVEAYQPPLDLYLLLEELDELPLLPLLTLIYDVLRAHGRLKGFEGSKRDIPFPSG